MKKVVIIRHIDLDGVGCTILAQEFFKNLGEHTSVHYEIKDIRTDYRDVNQKIIEILNEDDYDYLLILDIHPSLDVFKMLDGNKRVLIVDHHVTFGEMMDLYKRQNLYVAYTSKECATSIVLESLPRFINLTEKQNPYSMLRYLNRLVGFAELVNDHDL